MTATEVLKLWAKMSGRYDFLDESGEPTDDAFTILNFAQKWCEMQLAYPKHEAWMLKTVAAGTTLVTFSNCRYVKMVYLQDEDDATYKHEIEWKPAFRDVEETLESDDWLLSGIELNESDDERTIWIQAVWRMPTLTADGESAESVSYWTVQHPDVLMRAMSRQCEIDMRNTQGVQDFEVPLLNDIRRIYQDLKAEEMAGPPSLWRMR